MSDMDNSYLDDCRRCKIDAEDAADVLQIADGEEGDRHAEIGVKAVLRAIGIPAEYIVSMQCTDKPLVYIAEPETHHLQCASYPVDVHLASFHFEHAGEVFIRACVQFAFVFNLHVVANVGVVDERLFELEYNESKASLEVVRTINCDEQPPARFYECLSAADASCTVSTRGFDGIVRSCTALLRAANDNEVDEVESGLHWQTD